MELGGLVLESDPHVAPAIELMGRYQPAVERTDADTSELTAATTASLLPLLGHQAPGPQVEDPRPHRLQFGLQFIAVRPRSAEYAPRG